MAFEIRRFGSDSSNVKSILGGVNYYRYYNKDNNTLTTPGYFPADLGLEVGDRIHVVPATKTDPDEIYVVSTIVNGVITMKQIDTDGAVDSVNGKTGNVVLGANDVLPAQSGNSGKFLTTDGTDASWATIDTSIQVETMPTASVDELGKVYQFIGTTDANYTHGYFYECVSDGQEPATYSWTQTNVQPAPSGLPDQTGQSGKFLTTDGTDASWSDKPIENLSTYGLIIYGNVTANSGNSIVLGGKGSGEGATNTYTNSVVIGAKASSSAQAVVVIGKDAQASSYYASSSTVIGSSAKATQFGIAIGAEAVVSGQRAIQLGGGTNSVANTLKVGLSSSDNYTLLEADGTIPAARHAALPASDGTYVLKLVISGGVPTLSWVAE